MTEPDDDTKEHPIYPEAPPPVQRVPADASSGQGPAVPASVDPHDPITTVNVAPPAPASYPQPPNNQGWPGQPPGAANLPGQWPQTDYGTPGYGVPSAYPAAEPYGATAPTYGTSVFVALAAMLLVIVGVTLAVLGAWLLTQGPALTDLVQRLKSVDLVVLKPTKDQLRSLVSASPGALMVLGVLQLLVGAFVLGHRGWARWLGVVLALLGLIFGIVALTSTVALVPGVSVQLIVAIVFLVAYAFVILALIAGGGHFRARYPGR
jgi:hypothetical protein